jgi:hypothetical protein
MTYIDLYGLSQQDKLDKLNKIIFTPEYDFPCTNEKITFKCNCCKSFYFNKILEVSNKWGNDYYIYCYICHIGSKFAWITIDLNYKFSGMARFKQIYSITI